MHSIISIMECELCHALHTMNELVQSEGRCRACTALLDVDIDVLIYDSSDSSRWSQSDAADDSDSDVCSSWSGDEAVTTHDDGTRF